MIDIGGGFPPSFYYSNKKAPLNDQECLYFAVLSLGLGVVGNVYQLLEGSHIAYGEFSQNLAVHVHTGQLKAVDKTAVVGAAHTRSRVDTGDPQLAVFALLVLASNVGIRHGAHNLLRSGAILLGLGSEVALGKLEHLAAFLNGVSLRFSGRVGSLDGFTGFSSNKEGR